MFHVASGVFIVLVEVTAVRDLGGAHALGLITAALGVGGLVGGIVGMRLQPRRMLLWAFAALGLYPLFPLGFAWPGGLVAIMALALVAQAGLLYFDVGWQTAIQQGVPHDRLARVVSWDVLISFVALPLGNVLAGPLSAHVETARPHGRDRRLDARRRLLAAPRPQRPRLHPCVSLSPARRSRRRSRAPARWTGRPRCARRCRRRR